MRWSNPAASACGGIDVLDNNLGIAEVGGMVEAYFL
jgi:hypothetical protein